MSRRPNSRREDICGDRETESEELAGRIEKEVEKEERKGSWCWEAVYIKVAVVDAKDQWSLVR